MNGLAGYGDDSSPNEDYTSRASSSKHPGSHDFFTHGRSTGKSAEDISHPRRTYSDPRAVQEYSTTEEIMKSVGQSASPQLMNEFEGMDIDELSEIRRLLRPKELADLTDWGIPLETEEPCDEDLEAKLAKFGALKNDSHEPKHFNDSLMSNRSFRNPHLYAKLVEFVDVDESTTNFPTDVWDPRNVKDEWFCNRIGLSIHTARLVPRFGLTHNGHVTSSLWAHAIVAEDQKASEEQRAASQASGKRSKIDFTSSTSKSRSSNISSQRSYNRPDKLFGAVGVTSDGASRRQSGTSQTNASGRWR